MTHVSDPHVTDELLSAYLDNAVTAAERALIEEAVAQDADVAWRLNSLRLTVDLVRELPDIVAPRRFVLTEADVAELFVRPTAPPQAVSEPGFWVRIQRLFQSGNPLWRNAAAACALLLLLLVGGNRVLTPALQPTQTGSTEVAIVQEAAPAAAEPPMAAPAALVEEAVVADETAPAIADVAAAPQGPDTATTAVQRRTASTARNDADTASMPQQQPPSPLPPDAVAKSQPARDDTTAPEVEAIASMAIELQSNEDVGADPLAVIGAGSMDTRPMGPTGANELTAGQQPMGPQSLTVSEPTARQTAGEQTIPSLPSATRTADMEPMAAAVVVEPAISADTIDAAAVPAEEPAASSAPVAAQGEAAADNTDSAAVSMERSAEETAAVQLETAAPIDAVESSAAPIVGDPVALTEAPAEGSAPAAAVPAEELAEYSVAATPAQDTAAADLATAPPAAAAVPAEEVAADKTAAMADQSRSAPTQREAATSAPATAAPTPGVRLRNAQLGLVGLTLFFLLLWLLSRRHPRPRS